MKNIFALLIIISLCISLFSCGGGKKNDIQKAVVSDSISPEITKLNIKIKADPNNPDLYNERSKLLIEKQKLDEAFADIRTALNLDSSKASYFLTLSDVYFAKGKVKNCKLSIEKSMLLDPKYAEADLKYAELNLYFKEYKKTNEYIDKALAIDKINAKAYFMRGMTYKEIGDTAKAVVNFKTAIDQAADYYHAYIQLGILYSIKNNQIAVDYFLNALKLNSKSTEARYGLGMFYQENEEYEKAIEEYVSILKIDPKYKFAHYNLGYIYLVYLKNYEKAVTNFSNAITCDPKYAEAYYNRGFSYELLKDFKDAKADYKSALDLKTNYQKAIDGLNRIEKH
ncbi:MAG: tetratricopeptide repeat protein [Bacteroidetes bacterium]|nr:tetratricopeptide repeat protein [Bacteroidota bacterium]